MSADTKQKTFLSEEIRVSSLVAYVTGQALVKLEIGTETRVLSIAETRALIDSLIATASAAEADLVLVRFLRMNSEIRPDQVSAVLEAFRAFREG